MSPVAFAAAWTFVVAFAVVVFAVAVRPLD
jgi:hypothetical protein